MQTLVEENFNSQDSYQLEQEDIGPWETNQNAQDFLCYSRRRLEKTSSITTQHQPSSKQSEEQDLTIQTNQSEQRSQNHRTRQISLDKYSLKRKDGFSSIIIQQNLEFVPTPTHLSIQYNNHKTNNENLTEQSELRKKINQNMQDIYKRRRSQSEQESTQRLKKASKLRKQIKLNVVMEMKMILQNPSQTILKTDLSPTDFKNHSECMFQQYKELPEYLSKQERSEQLSIQLSKQEKDNEYEQYLQQLKEQQEQQEELQQQIKFDRQQKQEALEEEKLLQMQQQELEIQIKSKKDLLHQHYLLTSKKLEESPVLCPSVLQKCYRSKREVQNGKQSEMFKKRFESLLKVTPFSNWSPFKVKSPPAQKSPQQQLSVVSQQLQNQPTIQLGPTAISDYRVLSSRQKNKHIPDSSPMRTLQGIQTERFPLNKLNDKRNHSKNINIGNFSNLETEPDPKQISIKNYLKELNIISEGSQRTSELPTTHFTQERSSKLENKFSLKGEYKCKSLSNYEEGCTYSSINQVSRFPLISLNSKQQKQKEDLSKNSSNNTSTITINYKKAKFFKNPLPQLNVKLSSSSPQSPVSSVQVIQISREFL